MKAGSTSFGSNIHRIWASNPDDVNQQRYCQVSAMRNLKHNLFMFATRLLAQMLYTTSSSNHLKHHSEIYLSMPHENSEILLEHVTYEIQAAMRKSMKLSKQSAHVSVSCVHPYACLCKQPTHNITLNHPKNLTSASEFQIDQPEKQSPGTRVRKGSASTKVNPDTNLHHWLTLPIL